MVQNRPFSVWKYFFKMENYNWLISYLGLSLSFGYMTFAKSPYLFVP